MNLQYLLYIYIDAFKRVEEEKMAMIQCPSCGKQISDKAAKCPSCGCESILNEKKICAECGAELSQNEMVCHVCGCPVDVVSSSLPQQVEVTGVKISKKSKKNFFGIVIVLVLAIAVMVGAIQVNKQNTEVKYGENLELVSYMMLSGASDAETCGNLIKQVWYNAIYEERDSETDPYTCPNGYFVSDFNVALQNLFFDTSFSEKIKAIEENQSTVQSLMKELKDPPKKYEDAYQKLSNYYDAYVNFTNLVINPSGSLQTFSSNFNDADSEVLNCYNAMSLYLE